MVQPQDVRGRQRVAGSEGRVLDERRGWIEGRGDREDGRQLLVLDADQPRRLLGGVLRLRRDGGDRLTVVLRLAGGQDRPIDELRPEPGHRLGKVGCGHHQSDARDGQGGAGVDGDDPRPGAVEADELDLEDVLEADVGDVGLAAGDAVEAADAGGRVADALVLLIGSAALGPGGATAVGGGRRSGGPDFGGQQHRLDDLLVAGAATKVAGQAILDLGARRLGDVGQQGLRREQLAGDAEAALRGARVQERLLERMEPVAAWPGPRRSSRSCRPPRPRA